MKRITAKIPYQISDYISNKFRSEFLCDIKSYSNDNGKTFFLAEVSKDDLIHHLKFDENGQLVKEELDLAFPPDIHEEPFIDEGVNFEDY